MNITPLNGFVLVEPAQAATKTASGLYIPETATEKPTEGYVRALAADAGEEIVLGDRVIYTKYTGTAIMVDGVEYRLVPFADLLAKYTEADVIPD